MLVPTKLQCYIASIVLFVIIPSAQAKYSGGTGEPDNPYQIATPEDLILLGESPEDYNRYFILTSDIDMDPNLSGGKVFEKTVIAPDTNDVETGFQGIPFTGSFNGSNYTISNMVIHGINCLGLFGSVGQGAVISDLNLENISVDANDPNESFVGGLAAVNSGSVINCNCSGIITGGDNVGGLIGYNDYGDVDSCSASVSVTGNTNVGGLIGWNVNSTILSFG